MRPTLPATFVALHQDAHRAALRETNDCTVKAVAVALRIPYVESHELLRRAGRQNRKGFSVRKYEDVIRRHGYEVREVFCTGRLASYSCYSDELNELGLRGRTMRTVEHELATRFPGRVFLLLTTNARHVAAFDGKRLQDWSVGRRHRIERITEVLDPKTPKPEPFRGGVVYHTAPPAPPAPPASRVHANLLALAKVHGAVRLQTAQEELGLTAKQVRGAIDALRRQGHKFVSAGRGTGSWFLA